LRVFDTCAIRPSYQMGYHGIGVVCIGVLCQALNSIFIGKTIYRRIIKKLIYLANSTIPKLVRWRVILSEYQFVVHHISGVENVVADHLSRARRFCTTWMEDNRKMWLYKDLGIPRIFRFEGEVETGIITPNGHVEDEDEDDDSLPHYMKPKDS
jgi:hypothetical protein